MRNESIRPDSSAAPRRRVFGVGAAMLGTVAVLWLGAAAIIAHRLKYPPFLAAGNSDVYGAHVPVAAAAAAETPLTKFGAEFREISIAGGAGGWLIPAKSAAAVLLVPPAGATRRAMLPYAEFLHAGGFAVLAVDSGDSIHSGTEWGLDRRGPIVAAAAWLKSQGFEKVAALGVAEGAAASIMAQAGHPVFAAIVSDSSYASLGTMFRRIPSIAGLNPAFAATVMGGAWLWLGHDPDSIAPAKAAAHLGGASLLVIQNHGDQITPESDGKAIADAAGPRAELWIAPSDGHGDAIFETPGPYAARVVEFLMRALKTEAPAASPSR